MKPPVDPPSFDTLFQAALAQGTELANRMTDEHRLLNKTRQGKRYLFVVPDDLERRIRQP